MTTLFEVEPHWRTHWWGMPSFNMGDARPQYKITLNFETAADVQAFAEKTGLPVTVRSDSVWYPPRSSSRRECYYDGPKTNSRYPVCIPSKGRADCQKTGAALDRLGVSYQFFVEETEYEDYCHHVGAAHVVKMPFHDLGQGSIPARNFIWAWALEREHARHWVVDDNIRSFYRLTNNMGRRVFGGAFFQSMEDFVDRYENVVLAGPHHTGFVRSDRPNVAPLMWNNRVYSCILIDTRSDLRWRGRFNEDTDLSLRVLKRGDCTVLFCALQMDKQETVGAKSAKPMKGGNTDHVYNTGDDRLAFAQSLQSQHPDCVEVRWKFNRWHHHVDYSDFSGNRPLMKEGLIPVPVDNNYGMTLVTKDAGYRQRRTQ